MEIKIMPMKLEDLDRIMEIEHQSFTIPWSRTSFETEITKNGNAIYIIALLDNVIVGYAGMWKILDEGHITNIAVHPDNRKMKVGSNLVEALYAIAQKKNIRQITLEVRESNAAARKLYGKFGFTVAGRRKRYYADNNEDALIMWHVLSE